MKQRIVLICTLIALLIQSCATDTSEVVPQPEMVEIAIVADANEDTRLALEGNTTRWMANDCITLGLVKNSSSTLFATLKIESKDDISEDGKRAIFRGSVPSGIYYGVAAIYPACDTPANTITLSRSAEDNIYMSSFTSYATYPITIGASSEIPITFKHLMHKMDFKLSLAPGYYSNELNAEEIAIEITATDSNGTVSFATTADFDIRSGVLTTKDTATSVTAYGNGNNFSTMFFPNGTMTELSLTFGISINGEKRHEIRKPESGTIASLKMSPGKSTTVNLTLGEDTLISNGEEENIPTTLNLSANKYTITANGLDGATLSVVDEKGEDVTARCEIVVSNGSKLSGALFTATTAGSYTLWATCGEVTSNTITITAEAASDSSKSIVFADGVTPTSGWYDVNKYASGGNGDIQMCWAASASNIIQWWQDRYVAQGGTLPSTAVNGPSDKIYSDTGCKYELALMDLFHSEWDNQYGGSVFHAVPWYFEGKNVCASWGYQAQPLAPNSGGYFASAWDSSLVYNGYADFGYTSDLNGYGLWGNGTSLLGKDRLKKFSEYVVSAIDRGIASLTVSLASNINSLHHATTLWGYEIDNTTGLLTRVWLTDSDDMEQEPKTRIIHEYTVSIGDGMSHVQLSCPSVRYKNVWVVGIIPVSGPNLAK